MIDNLEEFISRLQGAERKMYEQILENSAITIVFGDEGRLEYVNKKYCNKTGFERDELSGRSFQSLLSEDNPQQFFTDLLKQIGQHGSWSGKFLIRKKDESSLWYDAHIYPLEVNTGQSRQYISVGCDITSFKNAIKIKDQFLANISHELRTPLHTIYSLGNLMAESSLNKEQNDYIENILNATNLLMRMVEDLLDLNKIEAGQVHIEKRLFNPQVLIQSLARMFSEKTREKQIDFFLEYDASLPEFVQGDPYRLKQILLHLLDNAVKYTDLGSIRLSCRLARQENGRTEFEFVVEDTGTGIPANSLNLIQEKFQQVRNDHMRPFGGPGVGLSIVKQLIQLHNGTFSINSTEEKGTRVVFTIPFDKASPEQQKQAPADKSSSEQPDLTPSSNGKPVTILIAEDADINQLVIKKHMQKLGFNADFADNGKIALEKLKTKYYDIVLMDMQMPVMDGYETIRTIRKEFTEPIKNIPIISITASLLSEASRKCLEAGADDYIPKPYDVAELKTKIDKWVVKNNKQSQSQSQSIQSTMQENYQSQNENSLIDLEYLEQLSEGDNDFTISMLSYFIDNAPGVISEMKQYYQEKDFKALRNVAHKFKPQLTFMGIKSIFQDVENIEQYAGNATNTEAIPGLIERTEKVCMKAMVEIKAELEKLL
ncbi:MAG: response regulator [Bacteroidales bacterium]